MKINLMNETEVKWVDRVGDVVAPIGLVGCLSATASVLGCPAVLAILGFGFAYTMVVFTIKVITK